MVLGRLAGLSLFANFADRMRYHFYTQREELINVTTHAAGIVLAVGMGTMLVLRTMQSAHPLWTLAVLLYLAGMLGSYVCSTLYHATPARYGLKQRLRQWDHAAIYWHIAGSYSPVTLIALLGQGWWGWALFVVEWACALVGTAVSFRNMERHSHFETLCFVLMGLAGLAAFGPLLHATSGITVGWIVAEGVCYLTGAVFYSVHRIRYMHSVFHFFVLAGSVCHVVAVWRILSEAV